MEKLIIYYYSKCSTCRRAVNWLKKRGYEYDVIDIVKNPPSQKLLTEALNFLGPDKKKIFNTRGKSYMALKLNDLNEFSHEEIVELLSKDGKLIKRPFLVFDFNKFLFGFNEEEYKLNLNQ